jgi:hypothetical protein
MRTDCIEELLRVLMISTKACVVVYLYTLIYRGPEDTRNVGTGQVGFRLNRGYERVAR